MISGVVYIKGDLVESTDEALIFDGFPFFFYEVKKNVFSKQDQLLVDSLCALLSGKNQVESSFVGHDSFLSSEFFDYFKNIVPLDLFSGRNPLTLDAVELALLQVSVKKAIENFFKEVPNPGLVASAVIDRVLGFSSLGCFLRDEKLEEIMVNGYGLDVFVFHRIHGMCKTNVVLSQEDLDSFIGRVSFFSGKKFDEQRPFLDTHFFGGNRLNATFSSLTPDGPTLTIRKFTLNPFSIVDLISNNTITSEAAAFLWLMVDGYNLKPMNMIIAGPSSCGKTTTLNVLCSFVRHSDRIITIEDALELNLGKRENWVKLETKPKIGNVPEVSMDDLLKNSLRMRPDRIILGEVRGIEAQTLFVAMDTGHEGSMGTLHANNSKEVLLRLLFPPMSVSESMLSLLDLIVVQSRMFVKGKGIIRRIVQIAEVSFMEKKALVGPLFEWDKDSDVLKRTDTPSRLIEDLSNKTQSTKKEIFREITVRKKILEFLKMKKITQTSDVGTVIQQYYFDPESILEMILKDSG